MLSAIANLHLEKVKPLFLATLTCYGENCSKRKHLLNGVKINRSANDTFLKKIIERPKYFHLKESFEVISLRRKM
jgi:hypothetical protein